MSFIMREKECHAVSSDVRCRSARRSLHIREMNGDSYYASEAAESGPQIRRQAPLHPPRVPIRTRSGQAGDVANHATLRALNSITRFGPETSINSIPALFSHDSISGTVNARTPITRSTVA